MLEPVLFYFWLHLTYLARLNGYQKNPPDMKQDPN